MTLTIDAAARTHVGRRRNNEDAYVLDPEVGLYAVADGMGGYEGGEVASRLVVHSLHEFFRMNGADAELTWPFGVDPERPLLESQLEVGVRLANRMVIRRRRGRLANMGSTVVAAALEGDRAILAHVGDSRIYHLRRGTLTALTRDHSLVEEMRAAGMRERPEGLGHVITRALGFAADTRPDLSAQRLARGDALLLCTDGVTDPLDDDAIAERLAEGTAAEAASAIVRAAYEAGGADNITALVIRVS